MIDFATDELLSIKQLANEVQRHSNTIISWMDTGVLVDGFFSKSMEPMRLRVRLEFLKIGSRRNSTYSAFSDFIERTNRVEWDEADVGPPWVILEKRGD